MHGPHYPIEKPKPFAERADKCCGELAEYEAMLRRMFGGNFPLAYVLTRAEALLTEAIRRGVSLVGYRRDDRKH